MSDTAGNEVEDEEMTKGDKKMQRWNEVFSGEEVTACGIKEKTALLEIRGKRRMKMKERPICRLSDHYSWIFPRGLVFRFQLPCSCSSLMADLCLQTFSSLLLLLLPILPQSS